MQIRLQQMGARLVRRNSAEVLHFKEVSGVLMQSYPQRCLCVCVIVELLTCCVNSVASHKLPHLNESVNKTLDEKQFFGNKHIIYVCVCRCVHVCL